MKISGIEFVKSAAGPQDFPRDRLPQLALVGRSNVGKSSLINALVKQKVAQTSAAPGKTRLINLYRVTIAGARASQGASPGQTFYLADLPGYGYARGGASSARLFEALTGAYFEHLAGSGAVTVALLAVDARHPGLPLDHQAWTWLQATGIPASVVATKIDCLSRAERARACRSLELSLNIPVLAVSARTGEGLDDLWKLIASLIAGKPRVPMPE